jgi:hypothetical protein
VDLVDLFGAGRPAGGLVDVSACRAYGQASWAGRWAGHWRRERPGACRQGRLVELAAEAVVLGFQVAKASLKGLTAGTRHGLHTFVIGEVPAVAMLPQPWSRDQLELDALYNFLRGRLDCSVILVDASLKIPGISGNEKCNSVA